MFDWLKQTSTIGGLLGITKTGIDLYQDGGTVGAIIMGIISAALLLIRDGAFLWKKKDEPKKKPKPGLGTGVLLVLAFGVAGCGGALNQFVDSHQDDIADLEACGIQCGVDLAADALACPINGGNIEDVVNAKGLAKDAAQCVLACMASKATDVLSEVCKNAGVQ